MSGRFDGLAERYRRYRPGYPEAAMAAIGAVCAKANFAQRTALDVGAGTGIATRALAAALGPGWRLLGLEPGLEMRRTAVRDLGGEADICFCDGAAEALPAEDGTIAVVLAAQALHWFDRPAFYAEAGRVLVPGGFLFVLYNDRDPEAPLIRDFDALMERALPSYSRHYRSFDYPAELAALAWAGEAASRCFDWVWRLAPEDFAGLMMSRSLTEPWTAALGEAEARAELVELARSHAGADGSVRLPYVTRLALARRAGQQIPTSASRKG